MIDVSDRVVDPTAQRLPDAHTTAHFTLDFLIGQRDRCVVNEPPNPERNPTMTAQTQTPKPSTKRWIDTRPAKGERCRRRNEAGAYCNREIGPEQRAKGWTWDADCVKEHHAAKRAEVKSSKPAPKRSNVVKLSDAQLARAADAAAGQTDAVPAEAMAAFATPALAEKAVAKRRAAKKAPSTTK